MSMIPLRSAQLAGLPLDLDGPAETRREAHASMAPSLVALQWRLLVAIREAPDGLTADQAAAAIGESVLACRPRITELQQKGKILPTQSRRANVSERLAVVWVAAA